MKAFLVGVAIVGVLFGLLMMYGRGLFSTRYAPGYSEAGFQRIHAGDRTNTVVQVLGQPLKKWTNDPSCIVWEYTECAGLGGFWKGRKVIMSNDVVVTKSSLVMD